MTRPIDLVAVRQAVASALEARGIGTRQFFEEILEGRRDDGPFMVGAIAWAERVDAMNRDAATKYAAAQDAEG